MAASEAPQDIKIVRILLVGDPQCGKTSIILALVGEEFPHFVPPRAEEITIPGDVTPEKVPTHIVDYSAQEQDDSVLQDEIDRAHVVCVIYDITSEGALDRVTGYWLPFIKQSSTSPSLSKPVILAGNKSDLPFDVDAHNTRLQEVLNAYLEVETGIECSAKELQNVSELFYFAQKAVLHPTAPLYSISDSSLKPACITALERIFKICDADNDNILNDQELNDFQIRCFDAPLQPQALQDVKSIVQRNTPLGVCNDGLTLEGFLFLNKLFILRGRHETTWKVVRRFGYSNSLMLRDEFLTPMINPQVDSSIELSESGVKFLVDLFKRYDKDGDQALSPSEQEDMFSICPEFMWDDLIGQTVSTNEQGWVTLEGFLAFWTLQTNLDYTCTAGFLAHMGYTILEKKSLASALKEVLPRGRDKTVFRCRVMGGRGCGKTTFCQSLVCNSKNNIVTEGDEDESVCIKAVTSGNSRIYLVLHESSYDPLEQFNASMPVSVLLENCDVVCLLYDSSERASFQSAVQIFNAIDSTVSDAIPCVFVATKTDLPSVEQVGELQPNDFCHEVDLPLPISVTTQNNGDSFSLAYARLAAVSLDPSQNMPSSFRIPRWIKMAGLGILLTAGVGTLLAFLFARMRRMNSNR